MDFEEGKTQRVFKKSVRKEDRQSRGVCLGEVSLIVSLDP